MEGRGPEIYQWVIKTVAKKLKQFLIDSDISVNERTYLIPHNGNLRMVLRLGEAIGIPPERVLNRIAERGNQSSASVFSTLAHYAEELGQFNSGDQLIFATFGGGVVYNFIAYLWP
jgi:3-oxoacyl-[acyl-carrier-protein] synthase-3